MPRLSAASVPTVAGLVLAASAVVVGVPVIGTPSVTPHPVAPTTATIPVAALPATRGIVADTGERSTRTFGLVGATWRAGTLSPGAQVELRVRQHGAWSGWTALSMPDGGPDGGSRDARAVAARHVTATDPLWVGAADGVEARVVSAGNATSTVVPAGLSVVLVNGGSSPADSAAHPASAPSMAAAAEAQPTIYTRAQWGADESLRTRNPGCGTPDYGSTIKMGFLHHTDGTNDYTSSAVPSIIRSIYAYHVESNGWCDIGYNFLVDRFGRIWEGRYGGITKPVIGAHTGGFNTDSFGVSLIGNFTSTAPPTAMLSAAEKLFAWRLGAYYRDPTATTTMLAGSFSGSRYTTGSTVTFKVISGHRDADTTTCPGSAAYAKLPAFRTAVKSLIGAGLVAPTISPTSIRMNSGQTVAVRSGVLASSQSWKLTVVNAAGVAIRTITGAATPTTPVATTWDGNDDLGVPAPPGNYAVELTSETSASSALPYSTTVTVTPPVTLNGPARIGYGQQVTLTGTAPTGTDVTLSLTKDGAALPDQTVHTTAPTWTSTFTADGDYTWSATADGYTTPVRSTKVAPLVTSPAPQKNTLFLTRGAALDLAGTALPAAGASVTVTATPTDGSTATSLPATVAANGSWSAVLRPSTVLSLVATDGRGLSSTPITVYPVDPPTAAAATSGYSARTLTISGNAGHAPVAVQVLTKAPGASTYTVVSTVPAATDGSYTARIALPTVSSSTSLPWRVATGYGADAAGTATVLPTFPPTASAPGSGHFGVATIYAGKAVPGDLVTLYTHPFGATTFVRTATATAASGTGAFSIAAVLSGDIVWKVTSPSGSTTTGQVVVVPTLKAPTSVVRRTTITLTGTGLPGQKVAVYQRFHGSTVKTLIGTVTISSTGRWSLARRVDHSSDFWCVSHNQTSRTVSVSTT